MPLKRLSGLFKRKSKHIEEEQVAAQEERKELIGEMSDNFQSMGTTMSMVQDHLQQSNESLGQIPELIRDQQELCRQVASTQEANQHLLVKVQEYFDQRDQVQQSVVDRLSGLQQQMQEQGTQYHDQLQKLSHTYKGSRRILVITIIFMAFIGTCLLAILLVVALRPDLLGIHSQRSAMMINPTNPKQQLLIEAMGSSEQEIRERAKIALGK